MYPKIVYNQEIFGTSFQRFEAHLQVECVVVQGSRQMVSWKPWAYYLVPRVGKYTRMGGWDVTRVFSDFWRVVFCRKSGWIGKFPTPSSKEEKQGKEMEKESRIERSKDLVALHHDTFCGMRSIWRWYDVDVPTNITGAVLLRPITLRSALVCFGLWGLHGLG